ncbi:MAG TPA: hypothetical protein VFR97_04935 [Capillimicrobium sp.]|nr:hypothetical protein [Capillimicrobium sp.]
MPRPWPASRLLLAFAGAWLAALLLLAVLVPYHATDALVFGAWSRGIADAGTLHTPDVSANLLHRPLFYGTQGLLWGLFGTHEWIGRVFAWLFMAVLVGCTARLAAGPRRDALLAGLAGVLLLAVPDAAVQAAAGQTDVPTAALVALVALLLFVASPSPWRSAALVLVTAAAVLAKPSALPALAGVLAATLVGPREELRGRLLHGALPVAGGIALALAYDWTQAHWLGLSLPDFLSGSLVDKAAAEESEAAFEKTYAEARRTVVLAAQWLGPYVAVLLLFSGVYALARLAGVAHRRAAVGALPAAVVLSWLLPFLAQDGERSLRVGPIEAGQPGATLAFLALLIPLWLFSRLDERDAPERATLARLVLWAAPVVLAWIVQAPTETRYLAAAWPPMAILMALVLGGAVRVAAARGAVAAAAVALLPVLLAVLNLRNLDGLGVRPDGTVSLARAAGDLRLSDLGDPDRMRAVADPQLAGLRDGLRAAAGPAGRVLTDDGRMTFYFDGRATVRAPRSCADVRGFAAVGLLGNVAVARPDLSDCGEVVVDVPGSHIVYAIR